MNIYDAVMKPLEKNILANIRKDLMPRAFGDVLELGVGTGANFKYYDPARIKSFTALDIRLKSVAGSRAGFPVGFVEGRAERLPFSDNHFDTAVETLVFCSVRDLQVSVGEVFRVLKPGGILIFIDHEKPPEGRLASAFGAVNLLWPKIAGGCNLTREPHKLIEAVGFAVEESGCAGRDIFHWGIARKA